MSEQLNRLNLLIALDVSVIILFVAGSTLWLYFTLEAIHKDIKELKKK